jgi:hypothetical protein
MLHPGDHKARRRRQEWSDFMCLQNPRAIHSENEGEKKKNLLIPDCDEEEDSATIGNKYLGNSRLGRE